MRLRSPEDFIQVHPSLLWSCMAWLNVNHMYPAYGALELCACCHHSCRMSERMQCMACLKVDYMHSAYTWCT